MNLLNKTEKHHVVVFGESGARILTVPDVSPYRDMERVAIDPDLSQVAALPPHFWQLVDGKVVPMSERDRAKRFHKAATEPPPKHKEIPRFYEKDPPLWWRQETCIVYGTALGILFSLVVELLTH